MADQNKDRGSSGDNLDRDDELQGTPGSRRRSSTDSEGMGDEEELTRGARETGRSGSPARPSNTGGSTSGTNRGSTSTGGTQNTRRSTDDIDIDDFDDIDDVSGNR